MTTTTTARKVVCSQGKAETMRRSLLVLGLGLAMVLGACGDDDDAGGGEGAAVVSEGMSPAEVEAILGEPTATVDLVDPETGTVTGFKATYAGEGGSWVSFEDDKVTGYIIGDYTGSP